MTQEEFDQKKDEVILKYLQGKPLTLDETAIAIAKDKDNILSKVSIAYIEKQALSKLAKRLKAKGLDYEDLKLLLR